MVSSLIRRFNSDDMMRCMAVLFSLLFVLHCNAKETLLIVGTVFARGEVCSGAKVHIYEGDQELVYEITPRTGNFFINIPKDKEVTMKIEKPGFLSKKVTVDTRVESFPDHRMLFFCDVNLLEETSMIGLYYGSFDKPLGVVSFNPSKKLFELQKFYMQLTRRELKTIKHDHKKLLKSKRRRRSKRLV